MNTCNSGDRYTMGNKTMLISFVCILIAFTTSCSSHTESYTSKEVDSTFFDQAVGDIWNRQVGTASLDILYWEGEEYLFRISPIVYFKDSDSLFMMKGAHEVEYITMAPFRPFYRSYLLYWVIHEEQLSIVDVKFHYHPEGALKQYPNHSYRKVLEDFTRIPFDNSGTKVKSMVSDGIYVNGVMPATWLTGAMDIAKLNSFWSYEKVSFIRVFFEKGKVVRMIQK